jgi:glycosyltransferase involved in cell wall biosynthesis/uncharacterized membrane protein YbhN (UPF0104 family)
VRVLHLTSTFPRFDGDPTGTFLADLVGAEQRAGVEVAVVAPHDRSLPVDGVTAGVAVHRFRYGPGRTETLAYRGGLLAAARRPGSLVMLPAYLLAMVVAAVTTGRRRSCELIHAHWWFPGGLLALVAARLLGVPYVVTLHGSDVHLARRPGLRWLARRVVGAAAAVTAVSASLAAEAASLLSVPVDRIRVLPMPVGFTPHRSAALLPPPPPLRLVGIGRLAPEKGFDVLVQAVVLLVAEGRAVELQIAGDGPEEARLRREGASLGGHFTLLGACSRLQVEQLVLGAHAVVIPSRREGLGMVAVEALTLGRPVVASDVGGLPDVVEDGVDGILVPPDDAEALAAGLRRLPAPPPRAAAVDAYRPEAVGEAHRALYADVLSEAAVAGTGAARWRPLRWLGALASVAVLAVLARIVVHDWPAIHKAWLHPNGTALAAAGVLTLLSEVGFGLASSAALSATIRATPTGSAAPVSVSAAASGSIGLAPVPMGKVAAAFWVAQTAKNIPGGVWAALARAGLADRWGVGPRVTVRWLATEALASCAAGGVVGGVGLALADQLNGHRTLAGLWALAAVLAALSPLSLLRASPVARILARFTGATPEPVAVARASAAYLPVWLAGSVAFAVLCRAVVPLDGRDLVLVGAASCVASIAGFLAVPVPSGLGVREAILLALLAPAMPAAVAVSLVLASRALAVVAQSLLALVALPAVRRDRVPVEVLEPAGGTTVGSAR